MRNWKQVLAAAGVLTILSAAPAYAAGWQWIDNNSDGVSECYYIGDDGKALTGTTTPDGFTVNEQGVWIVNGAVQTQQKAAVVKNSPSELIRGSIKTSQLDSMQYYLYKPKNATENMPLIISLHSHGMKENANALRSDTFYTTIRECGESAYVLAPFLSSEWNNGEAGMWPAIEPSIMELIEYVISANQIDRKKVIIIGQSMGADGAIQIVSAHPEVFSCMIGIVPFHYKCPIAKWDDSWGEKLKTVPTWFFIEDENSAKEMATAATNAINAAGGQAWLEIEQGKDHGTAEGSVLSRMRSGQTDIYGWATSISK